MSIGPFGMVGIISCLVGLLDAALAPARFQFCAMTIGVRVAKRQDLQIMLVPCFCRLPAVR
jgi:hypothetical protein